MTGLFLLFIATAWIAVAAAIAYASTSSIRMKTLRFLLSVAVWGLLLPLPLIDELVGKLQFDRLCNEYSAIQIDANARGKTVYLEETSDVELQGTWLRIVRKPWRFVDAQSRDSVVVYNTLLADGGWLVRSLSLTEGGAPISFRGSCSPKNRPASIQTFKALGIQYIEPPLSQAGQKQ